MDWNVAYVVSRFLRLEISRSGELVASASGPARIVQADAVPVLQAFAQPVTPAEAFDRLAREWDLDRDGFGMVLADLVEDGYLVPAGSEAEAVRAPGPDAVVSQLRALRDSARVMAYKSAIDRCCRDRVVLEIGSGMGIFSLFAAQAGARRVVAVEEGGIAGLAERLFQANGCEGIAEVHRGSSLELELDEPADVLIHQIVSVEPPSESVLHLLRDAARRLLRPERRLLPSRLEVFCAGVELREDPRSERPRVLAEMADLGALYGVGFGPLLEDLAATDDRSFRPSISVGEAHLFPLPILSAEHRLLSLDYRDGGPELTRRGNLRILRAGRLGGIALFFRAHLDEHTWITNSPFVPRTSWSWDIRPLSRDVAVQPGDEIPLATNLDLHSSRPILNVDLAQP
jgi:hypothetical protein